MLLQVCAFQGSRKVLQKRANIIRHSLRNQNIEMIFIAFHMTKQGSLDLPHVALCHLERDKHILPSVDPKGRYFNLAQNLSLNQKLLSERIELFKGVELQMKSYGRAGAKLIAKQIQSHFPAIIGCLTPKIPHRAWVEVG